jgi:type II secretory pathway pseudopilin PulG
VTGLSILIAPRQRGVTFFEVTVVFAVIALLSIFVVLGTRRLVIDTKVTRVREDHRAVSRALQSYFVDHYNFPPERGPGLQSLQTPTTYLASIPADVFALRDERATPYVYRTWEIGSQVVWILASRGPDGDMDFEPSPPVSLSSTAPSPREMAPPLPDDLIRLSYDPTNGMRSSGDIFTVCPYVVR